MKESRKNLKLKARRAMLGKYPVAIGIYIFTGVIGMLLVSLIAIGIILFGGILLPALSDNIVLVALLGLFALGMLVFLCFICLMVPGYFRFYLNVCQGRQARFTDIFWGFGSCRGKFWGIGLMITLLCAFLMTPVVVVTAALEVTEEVLFPTIFLMGYNLCLSVIGVYVSLTYGQFYLVLADHPELSVFQALGESRRLMKGNRWRYFVLGLSFLGWMVIVYITFGWAALWLIPYIMSTNVFFYLNLKELYRE